MRKVVLYALLSLDGVAESPEEWVFDFDDEMEANLAQVIERQDTVLLGRRTYDEWAGYWPASDIEPFASFINGVHKHVVTSSTPSLPWASSTVVDRPLHEHVTELKGGDGGDVGVHGSIELARSLLRAGLVDELRLVVFPVLAGQGRRLVESVGSLRRLGLHGVTRTASGGLLLEYDVENGASGHGPG